MSDNILYRLDFTKNRTWAVTVQIVAIVLLMVPWLFYWDLFMKYSVLILVAVLVIVPLHEALHGILFKLWTGKVRFGFVITLAFPAFYSTSESEISRNRFIAIALIPQILTIIALLCAELSSLSEFGIACCVACASFNLSGGCSDFIVAGKLLTLPSSVRVKDDKIGITIYGGING